MTIDRLTPFELMEKLVSFPTVSRDSNLDLVDWVEDYLKSHEITSYRKYDETGEKAALVAHVGPEIDGGLILSGHTDVVPVDGQPWDSDPWSVVEKEGRYFGRGVCDMKGFDALAIWALVEGLGASLGASLEGCLGAFLGRSFRVLLGRSLGVVLGGSLGVVLGECLGVVLGGCLGVVLGGCLGVILGGCLGVVLG